LGGGAFHRTQIHAYLPTRRLLRGSTVAPDGGLTLLFGDYRAPVESSYGTCAARYDQLAATRWGW
jgi:hypothetical protein